MKATLVSLLAIAILASCTPKEQTCWVCDVKEVHPPKADTVYKRIVCGKSKDEIRSYEKEWSVYGRGHVDGRTVPFYTHVTCR